MATEKQIAANQRNAALSTGPKTAEGKARSRANAMTHGLTAVTLVSPAQQTDAELRYAAWLPSFKPEDDFQKFQVRTVVEASLRIENCWARESERKTELAGIATESSTRWEVERKKEASKLGRSLRRNPEEIALQLRSTPAGREWMIGRWTLLLKAVSKEQIGSWRGPESSEALDLMGKPKFLRNLLDQDNLFPDPDTIRVLILKEIAALEVDQRNATQEDHRLRGLHARGLIFETDAALTRIRRYESSAQRLFDKSVNLIKKAKLAAIVKPAVAVTRRDSSPIEVTKPIPASLMPRVKSPIIADEVASGAKTNPISMATATRIASPEPTHQVEMVDEVSKKQPGNRHYRRQLQKQSRHQAYLTRIAS